MTTTTRFQNVIHPDWAKEEGEAKGVGRTDEGNHDQLSLIPGLYLCSRVLLRRHPSHCQTANMLGFQINDVQIKVETESC